MDLAEKLEILADSAKYDVACTSSGVDRPDGTVHWAAVRRRASATPSRRTGGASPS